MPRSNAIAGSRNSTSQHAQGLPRLRTRVGFQSGEAVVCSVGSNDRLQYTAMGDTINLASRLEGLNKQFGTAIIASGSVELKCRDAIRFRRLGEVTAKGKTIPIEIYEVIGAQGDG